MGVRPHFAATPVRGFWPAAALALCVLLGPAPALCGQSAGGMVQDALDSLTKSPDARVKGHGVSQGGPVAPQQPKAPQVPGAMNKGEADPFPARQTQPNQPNQPNQAGRAQAPARNQARQQVLTLRHDGVDRRALLTLPKGAPLKKGQAAPKTPVIIVLHGAGGSALQAMRQTGLAGRAAAAGYLAVFPDGLGPAEANGEGQTWNAWTCCGYARDQRVDDVGFLSALINRLRTDYGADPRRIYLAGFSNGAMLASRFVLERPGAAAALAVVAGYLPCDAPRPAEPLPVLIIHGAQDNVARVAPTKAHPATGRFCEDHPARAQVDHWVNGMDLSVKGQVRDAANAAVRVEEYGPANGSSKAGGRVRVVIVKNGGHAWPGGARERFRYCDAPSAGPDATGLVLEFFGRQQGGAAAAPAKAGVKAGVKAGTKAKK